MPSARPIVVFLGFVALPTFLTFFTLLRAHPQQDSLTESAPSQRGAFRSFFSFHTPSSLFPASAIISLTDDNSTFFLSRPADFGPRLAPNGLSGPLWVGSGFGDDNTWRGGAGGSREGELGCSDIPGWQQGDQERHGDTSFRQSGYTNTDTSSKSGLDGYRAALPDDSGLAEPDILAGTDDHLHFPLPDTQLFKSGQPRDVVASNEGHADIQSLQETAKITGRVVLLSRGGCGFLEKVKWAQRRGAAALVVGDDTRGGALVTMYARGDTSNVSIPSLFTSRTTAHLLSSLIPQEDYDYDDDDDLENIMLTGTAKTSSIANDDRPNFTAATEAPRPTSTGVVRRKGSRKSKSASRKAILKSLRQKTPQRSFWQRLGFGNRQGAKALGKDSHRPPSSGRLNWVNEKFNEEIVLEKRAGAQSDVQTSNPTQSQKTSDGFQIGVQDWRDPDFVATKSADSTSSSKANTMAAMPTSFKSSSSGGRQILSEENEKKTFSGGSITPGSGEYYHNPEDLRGSASSNHEDGEDDQDDGNWLSRALWGHQPEQSGPDIDIDEHDGLWVTLSPTTMSTTPFFDTLLVLVVSPLITLTVVYALLLLRSRIRRRRWRAPKSVVERLPIRTYQTMPASSTTSSSRMATPFTSSPTSPLLQSRAQSIHSRSRAQSKADSDMGNNLSVSLDKAAAHAALKQDDNEKPARVSKPKKKYKGRQVECVVCLEEYIEGQSQVMSLPCGHEFHAECITPWLTTRRRTCPICKNDVVRSMARATASNEPASPDHNNARSDDVQTLAAETTNESPSAAIPIPRDNNNNDIERGDDMAATLVEDQSGRRGWRGLASFSLSAFSGEAAWRQAQADRNR